VSWQSDSLRGSSGCEIEAGRRSQSAAQSSERVDTEAVRVSPLTKANLMEATVPPEYRASEERGGRNSVRGRFVKVAGCVWEFLKKI